LTKTKCSRRWNGSSLEWISSFAALSLESLKKIFQEMKRASEGALERLVGCSAQKMGKRELAEGVWGVFIPSLTKTIGGIYTLTRKKLAVDKRVPGYSGYISRYSGHS
jgi:hypothetical protein